MLLKKIVVSINNLVFHPIFLFFIVQFKYFREFQVLAASAHACGWKVFFFAKVSRLQPQNKLLKFILSIFDVCQTFLCKSTENKWKSVAKILLDSFLEETFIHKYMYACLLWQKLHFWNVLYYGFVMFISEYFLYSLLC